MSTPVELVEDEDEAPCIEEDVGRGGDFHRVGQQQSSRHPLYDVLTATADADGHSGDIRWNFEKFLVGRDGEVLARFAPQVEPEDPAVVAAIEAAL